MHVRPVLARGLLDNWKWKTLLLQQLGRQPNVKSSSRMHQNCTWFQTTASSLAALSTLTSSCKLRRNLLPLVNLVVRVDCSVLRRQCVRWMESLKQFMLDAVFMLSRSMHKCDLHQTPDKFLYYLFQMLLVEITSVRTKITAFVNKNQKL